MKFFYPPKYAKTVIRFSFQNQDSVYLSFLPMLKAQAEDFKFGH